MTEAHTSISNPPTGCAADKLCDHREHHVALEMLVCAVKAHAKLSAHRENHDQEILA